MTLFVSFSGSAQSCREYYEGLGPYIENLKVVPAFEKGDHDYLLAFGIFKEAKRTLNEAIATQGNRWQKYEENDDRPIIYDPNHLKGKVIAGLEVVELANGSYGVRTFAGKVKKVSEDFAEFDLEIETLSGKKTIIGYTIRNFFVLK